MKLEFDLDVLKPHAPSIDYVAGALMEIEGVKNVRVKLDELDQKTAEFATHTDNLEEVFENREQIEIAKFYERLPKPTLIAVHEFLNEKIYIRNPHKTTATNF